MKLLLTLPALLLVSILLADEPKSPPPDLRAATKPRELDGYLLNREESGFGCIFLDSGTNLCKIYDTRPLVCRLFNCAGEGREQLVELGILPRPAKE